MQPLRRCTYCGKEAEVIYHRIGRARWHHECVLIILAKWKEYYDAVRASGSD